MMLWGAFGSTFMCKGKVDIKHTDVNNAHMGERENLNFPEAGLEFLKKLRRNNNRDWFQKHKPVYEESVRQPMERLVEAMAAKFAAFAPEILASPKVSLFRIYRDTRFAKDKKPYKTHVAAVFPHRSLEKHEGACFYFHLAPGEFFIGGGLWRPLPEELRAVREYIADQFQRFEAIIQARSFRRMFGELTGEQLTRPPRGFPAEHPAAEYLRFKQFLASRTLQTDLATSHLSETLVETFRTLHPLIGFLNEPIVANRKFKQRQDALLKHA
jgi:uncharacterized protein (TIGR02453 family)